MALRRGGAAAALGALSALVLLLVAAAEALAAAPQQFMQISDIHLDTLYSPTALSAACHHSAIQKGAQPFGRYGCDASEALALAMLQQAFVQSKADNVTFVLMTGDCAAHKQASQAALESNEATTLSLFERAGFVATDPSVPTLLPVLGNEDAFPDYDLGPNFALLGDIYALWRAHGWLKDDERDTFVLGGFYSRAVSPTVTVAVLNTLMWSHDNPNTSVTSLKDPAGQMAWLGDVLKSASKAGRGVFITGHMPPGVHPDSKHALWHDHFIKAFRALVLEYAGVIGGMFFAHIHYDAVRLIVDDAGQPVSMAFAAASITTRSFTNPGYRVYTYTDPADGSSIVLNTFVQYMANLTDANDKGSVTVTAEYDAAQSYGLDNLSDPVQLVQLVDYLNTDAGIALYGRHSIVESEYGPAFSAQSYRCAVNYIEQTAYDTCMQQQQPPLALARHPY